MKKHTNKTHHRHNHLIPPSSLQHPPHLFNTNHAQPLHLIFKACFSPNHSTPIRNRKVTILTPTKSQSKYSTIIMILYACTNEKYLIPISVPILPHTTPQDRIIPHTIILHSTNILTVLYKQHSTFFLSTHYLLLITVSNSTSPQTSPPLHYNSIHQTSYTLPTRHPHKPTLHPHPHIQLTIHYTTPTPTHYNHAIQQIRIYINLTPITNSL